MVRIARYLHANDARQGCARNIRDEGEIIGLTGDRNGGWLCLRGYASPCTCNRGRWGIEFVGIACSSTIRFIVIALLLLVQQSLCRCTYVSSAVQMALFPWISVDGAGCPYLVGQIVPRPSSLFSDNIRGHFQQEI